ncbi:MAG TPA: NAD-dependent epimerase/dehydratase family protein [Pyrinomonadaceae bacterium]|nr:NAD-dependent epimerase/dehydratase family protein [Pyrinomonadaceae bacterium]
MKILVTGSNGFVGGSVGRAAARAGHELLGVARASQPARGWPGRFAQADALASDLSGIVRDFAPGAVFHCAGTASVAASFAAPLDDLRAAVLTFANLLEAVRRAAPEALVVFPSSAAVYGDPPRLPVGEETPARPISPYGFHKAACEMLAREYAECFGLRAAVCRLFSVFGPAQRRLLVWELFRQFAGPDDTVWLEGTGRETRDYLHADDAASALLAVAERLSDDPSAPRLTTLNVASGVETSALELAERIRARVAPRKTIRCRNVARAGDPRAWRADVTRLRALAPGWQPRPLDEALASCVADWQREVI